MLNKKYLFFLLTLIVILVITVDVFASSEKKIINIGLITIDIDIPYWQRVYIGVKEFEKQYPVKVDIVGGKGRVDLQIEQLENMIERGVDAIIIDPADIAPLRSVVLKAVKKGIPVQISNQILEGATQSVKYNETVTTEKIGKKTIELLTERYGEPKGNVAIMLGTLGNSCSEEREQGYEKYLEDFPNIKIVTKEPADWDPVKAMSVMEDWLVAYPDLDLVFAANDGMGGPAAEVIKSAGKSDQIYVLTTDGNPSALETMREGLINYNRIHPAVIAGWTHAYWAYKAALGESVPEVVYIDTMGVSTLNLEMGIELLKRMRENPEDFDLSKPIGEHFVNFAQEISTY